MLTVYTLCPSPRVKSRQEQAKAADSPPGPPSRGPSSVTPSTAGEKKVKTSAHRHPPLPAVSSATSLLCDLSKWPNLSVFRPQGCWKKVLQTGCLKTTDMYPLIVLEGSRPLCKLLVAVAFTPISAPPPPCMSFSSYKDSSPTGLGAAYSSVTNKCNHPIFKSIFYNFYLFLRGCVREK